MKTINMLNFGLLALAETAPFRQLAVRTFGHCLNVEASGNGNPYTLYVAMRTAFLNVQ